jgi:cobalt/nickel transport system ATP-binding protein
MTPVFEFEDVCYTYPGQPQPALQGATLSVRAGQKVVVLGRNGSGKSTLFLHSNGILRPSRGLVRFKGQPLRYDRASLLALRRQVGIIFQNPDDQLFSASVAQDISFGPLNLGLSGEEARQRVQAAAELCEITDLLDCPTHALSGGQKARVALAGLLAMDPLFLIVDEITTSLDAPIRRQIFTLFQQLVTQGKTVMLATHDLDEARYWADWVVLMEAGRIIAADTPERIFANRGLLERLGMAEPWYAPFVNGRQSAARSSQVCGTSER